MRGLSGRLAYKWPGYGNSQVNAKHTIKTEKRIIMAAENTTIANELFDADFAGTGFTYEQFAQEVNLVKTSDRAVYKIAKKWTKGARNAMLETGNVRAINRILRVFKECENPYAYKQLVNNFAVFCGAFRMVSTTSGSTYREFVKDTALVSVNKNGFFDSEWTPEKAEACRNTLNIVDTGHIFKLQWRNPPKQEDALAKAMDSTLTALERLHKAWTKSNPDNANYDAARGILQALSGMYPDLAPKTAEERQQQFMAALKEVIADAAETN